jgi:hypothetical protein
MLHNSEGGMPKINMRGILILLLRPRTYPTYKCSTESEKYHFLRFLFIFYTILPLIICKFQRVFFLIG